MQTYYLRQRLSLLTTALHDEERTIHTYDHVIRVLHDAGVFEDRRKKNFGTGLQNNKFSGNINGPECHILIGCEDGVP